MRWCRRHPTFANGPIAFSQLGDLATDPVDGTGAAINLNQTPAEAAMSMNCTLSVPANPLTAKGLATPWQLGDGCSQANFGTEGAFVEATILAPNGKLQVYNPLVITAGTTPAAAQVQPKIARGSAVIIDVGFNGTNLVLVGPGAQQGNCVDALGQSVIGQVSACNAVSFYRMANFEIADRLLKVPALGTSADGQACLTTRSFAVVDQDQSDNVITSYLMNGNGQTAQDTAVNTAALMRCADHRERQRRQAAGRVPRPGQRLHPVHRAGHHRSGRSVRLAGPERAERPGQPARCRRGGAAER